MLRPKQELTPSRPVYLPSRSLTEHPEQTMHAAPACPSVALPAGAILAHSHVDLQLHLYTVNCRHLASAGEAAHKGGAAAFSGSGRAAAADIMPAIGTLA